MAQVPLEGYPKISRVMQVLKLILAYPGLCKSTQFITCYPGISHFRKLVLGYPGISRLAQPVVFPDAGTGMIIMIIMMIPGPTEAVTAAYAEQAHK